MFYRVLRHVNSGGSVAIGMTDSGDPAYGGKSVIFDWCDHARGWMAKAQSTLPDLPGNGPYYVQTLSESEREGVRRLEAER